MNVDWAIRNFRDTDDNLMPDLPLLRKAVDWVRTQDELGWSEGREWYQGGWRRRLTCGTTYCVAGYVTQLYDVEWISTGHVMLDGAVTWVGDVAREKLGITRFEASSLFHPENRMDDVVRVAEAIARRAGERL